MKKVFSLLLALFLAVVLVPVKAEAANVASGPCGDNLTWTLDDAGTLTISGEGEMADYYGPVSFGTSEYDYSGCAPWYDYRNNIITVIIQNDVTSIGSYAFYECSSLTCVTIPNGVASIGDSAFWYCTNLASITIPDNVTHIGDLTFSQCDSLTSITIPQGVTSIDRSFFSCDNLSRVEFMGNAPTIEESAFYDVTATSYYPANNATWTDDVMRDYGGDITWVPYTPLKIATQPKSVTVAEGEVAKVTVKAEGDGLYYRWYYKNAGASSYTYTSSFKGNTYSVTMNDARNGRQVLCRVYDKYGNVVQTNTVKLSMEKSTVKITQQPVSVTVANGATAKVTVKATGDGLTYRWYFKNVGDTKYYYTSSFTGNTYSVTMNEARNGRQVLCRVYDKYGNVVQTNTVKLSMASGLRIVTQPKDAYTQLGSKINISVKAEGEGLTYDWYVKDVIDPEYVLSSIKSSTYAPYMTEDKAGRYAYCVITDKYGNSVKTDVVRMWLTATITKQPVSVTVAEGKTAKVTVGAVGDGLTYRWYFKNVGDTKYYYTSSFTGNTYSVTMNEARNGRQVLCRVYDKYGNVVQTNTVTLKMS